MNVIKILVLGAGTRKLYKYEISLKQTHRKVPGARNERMLLKLRGIFCVDIESSGSFS
jgi:hypothetical protein